MGHSKEGLNEFTLATNDCAPGLKTVSLSCKVTSIFKRTVEDEHHDLQSGLNALKRILFLLQTGHYLKGSSNTDYLISFEKALDQVTPSIELINRLYDFIRTEATDSETTHGLVSRIYSQFRNQQEIKNQ